MTATLLVTAGTGPVEVRRFVAELAPALADRLAAGGVPVEALVLWDAPEAPRSAALVLPPAPPVDALLGTHALVSAERGRRARRRWFAAVRLLPDADTAPLAVDPADLRWSTARAGGPGGQHVNTTASAVRLLHVPSGLQVRVTSERSQARNRAVAMQRLGEALARQAAAAAADRDRRIWRLHHGLQRGAPVLTWRRARDGTLMPNRFDSSDRFGMRGSARGVPLEP